MITSRWRTAIITALVGGALLAAPATTATASAACTPSAVPSGLTGKSVVIVTHGWVGTELTDTINGLRGKLDQTKWAVVPFDYPGALAAQWPDTSGVTICLGQSIQSLHEATGSNNGNIYIVAHSMGGLLTRFTLANPDIGKLVAGVVTIDTPHHGSPLAATWLAKVAGQKNITGNAYKCLALHHPGPMVSGCGAPPFLPPGVPIAQLAGDVTISRNFFAFGYSGLNTNSDGAVWTDSQTGYATSADGTAPPGAVTAQTITCETGAWNLLPIIAQFGLDGFNTRGGDPFGIGWAKVLASGSVAINASSGSLAMLTLINATAACGHTNMPKNADAIARTANALKSMPNRTPIWLIDGTGIGPVKVMGSLAAVRADPSVTVNDNGAICGVVDAPSGWSITYSVGGDDISGELALWGHGNGDNGYPPDTPRTAKGITLGATGAEFHAAYPDATVSTLPWDHSNAEEGYQTWVVDLGGPVAFSLHNGHVDDILAGLDGIPSEMCG